MHDSSPLKTFVFGITILKMQTFINRDQFISFCRFPIGAFYIPKVYSMRLMAMHLNLDNVF
jgi:hypothetical protein